ncbi:DUF1059 domain-containing protein [Marinobacterium sp. D7]|uniref:DUF1059 domain-containing protein n=1 Tax=Marinobacterium ramblicola TaxID=2849041 RepID=UPI001C2D21EB|nr:DUF1059 domain-containing protein [Marinobacterium ramblicola]MBV1787425.1 DUF1059 domain-containing protein [Marinobacterium ramblicola]
MSRYYIDCRESPSESNCTVAMSADTKEELIEAVIEHARSVHGHEDTPEFRAMVMQGMKEGTPPVEAPKVA